MKAFLDKYDTVIFDMDGVITSEQNYWTCAALTVKEVLEGHHYFGNTVLDAAHMSENSAKIRSEVFVNDELIAVLKGKGVNSNWDLGYVTVLITLILGTDDFKKVLEYARTLSDNILDEYDRLSLLAKDKLGCGLEYTRRNGKLWNDMQYCFQEWFLGDELFLKQYGRASKSAGKPGLVYSESPIVPVDKIKTLLNELSLSKRVCTGTGRPAAEMKVPLENWGVIDCFAKDGLCNFDHVVSAEERLGNTALTKPHPYMFLKALYGTDYDDEKIINGDYDKSKIDRTLIVGDAGADILAAKAMGADFCAVLTGVNGKAARGFFENLNAEYILNNVTEMI